ncbi:bifunctional metallophosphatase/5'-nucleotidase [Hyunsoonleella ulvae]|uniref:bifunctional metallophosphatase/5'-nucleotidase n=1 Tax=Hyunsoonleella ulvae TaxID=2799948 RepID=UPI001939C340|nr:metallophosphatase [Hyunsoonleella ulvae]
MRRRDFIQKVSTGTTALAAIGSLGLQSFAPKPKATKITILHTNDVHSHIDTFGPDEGRNANKGGVARRAALIDSIRQQNPNTLLFDAGDIFQGTPYFNYYGGELEIKLMSKLKYDLATIGNHDFDNGINGFYAQLPHADFNFVSANYDFSSTLLDTHVKPYQIFKKGGVKIGVFGLGIELNGLVEKRLYKETKYLDPIEITQDITRILKYDEQCDLIICLSHLGYDYRNNPDKISDLKLAKLTKDIDLIIGGHTHTFLSKPSIVKNSENKELLVNQVGCYGLYLGQIDFFFDTNKNKTAKGVSITV